MSTNYHTQHSPFGAFASFTVGLHDSPGGFGIGLSGPANQNIYVGYRVAGGEWQLLPFFASTKSLAEAFTTDQVPPAGATRTAPSGFRKFSAEEFTRTLQWASDRWEAGQFAFSIYSPFGRISDEASLNGDVTVPVIAAALEFDNRAGVGDVELIFGYGEPAQPPRPLSDAAPDLIGFATGRRYGFATPPSPHVRLVQGHTVLTPSPAYRDGFQRIGADVAVILRIAAGSRGTLPLALGFFEAGFVTAGLDCSYLYTRYFASLESVLRHGLSHHADLIAAGAARDAELAASRLSPDQRWLLAQATHSYYGSSQLLDHGGRPLWNVNEGEYRMINTFDLTVDHLFFELTWHPWAVRNTLDLFATRYAYREGVHSPDGRRGAGGVSFTHDMGVANQFSPPGISSYECTEVHGCFSHMTMEQLVNWVLCAVSYAEKNNDLPWLESRLTLLLECKTSLENRDDPEPAKRTGVLKWDSDRCGSTGEITTYDSLDTSLGQARNNLYLAVKTLAAWLLLEHAFKRLGRDDDHAASSRTTDLLARTLSQQFENATGFFPAVFEGGNRSRILPAVEGLAFPLFLGLDAELARDGRFAELLSQLETHLRNALRPGVCLDAATGAWKLSSTSRNTWMSKIAIAQHVTRQLFPAALNPSASAADRVHAAWEQSPGCGAFAMCDQIQSETGVAIGSKYYPRIVSAILWLHE
jgi:hypothetical protein